MFGKLPARCRGPAPRHRFRFHNKVISFDSTLIDLCLLVFPWARFRQAKGGIKLHVGLDHDGLIPCFAAVTDGKQHDITVARAKQLSPATRSEGKNSSRPSITSVGTRSKLDGRGLPRPYPFRYHPFSQSTPLEPPYP